MDSEEKKFLDLDMIAEKIPNDGDREMFREAVRCYHIGSHRAAVILVWIATADCLKRRVEELATEGDPLAHDAWEILKKVDGEWKFEQNLIDQSKTCDFLDEYDHQCVSFARNTRSKCAHPGGTIPSAEAVRHILQICSQVVLCRTGYRGRAYIKEIVTTHFDSHFFLPPEGSPEPRCTVIINRVPRRLWGQFTAVAAAERSKASLETWRKNSVSFFSVLFKIADDIGTAKLIAAGMKGFKTEAPEYFSTLVGLDRRMAQFWTEEERKQARAHLSHVSLTRVNADAVHSWANLCTDDAFEPADIELLSKRISVLSRHFPDTFLVMRRADLYALLAANAESDATAEVTAVALRNLLPTALADESSLDSDRILRQVIIRFADSERYRALLLHIASWRTSLLIQFLELSEYFLSECDEENAEDITILFEAVSELMRRNPTTIPVAFNLAVAKVLNGESRSEWRATDSLAGGRFLNELVGFLNRYPDELGTLRSATSAGIPAYRAILDGPAT